MKIPETSANVGAYYGNEENVQWQPNGVIVDTGVGGGVVGSGDAGAHPPPMYPVHVRHGHIPGYVMAGAYYPPAPYAPPAPAQDDFEDYMWMENEEEFDKQVMQQLEEEALMEQCIEAMLEDEQRERRQRPTANGHANIAATTSNGVSSLSLEETVSRSTLNPLAAEFVPTTVRTVTPSTTQDKPSPPSTPVTPSDDVTEPGDDQSTRCGAELTHSTVSDVKSEESSPSTQDPPEVSATAEIHPPITEASKQSTAEVKTKTPSKKPTKTETAKQPVKAKKSAPIKVEAKPTLKKKEVKSVKSEEKVEETVEQSPPPVQTPPTTEEPQTGFKPINYAAAAKANKPKKPTGPSEKTPPPAVAEKTSSVNVKVTEKSAVNVKVPEKSAVKVAADKTSDKKEKPVPKTTKMAEKVVQRKNSAK